MHLFQYNDTITRTCQLNSSDYADTVRIGLVGFFGTGVATLSLIENIILFYVFSTSQKLRRQNYANPVILAFFDSLVSLCYILTSSINVIALGTGSVTLIKLWASYMRVAYCVQHFSLTVSNFLLVVASLERYLANGPMLKQNCQRRMLVLIVGNKTLVLFMIFFLSFLFKATLFFETDTLQIVECHELESYVPIWLTNAADNTAWLRFWTRKIFTIIFPFILLAFCNARIVFHLHHKRIKAKKQSVALKQQRPDHQRSFRTHNQSIRRRYSEKRGVRVATRTLVMVVGCYLISNSMSTIINIWEYFDSFFLRHRHYYAYLIASDFSVLLTIAGCALRLPIYVINDGRIRKAIFRALIRLRYCYRKKQVQTLANDGQLEKWSIVVVSNSLRSNVTNGAYSEMRGKKSFDHLALLVQDRRRFLVQMTINLGAVKEIPREENFWDSTDLQEEHLKMIANGEESNGNNGAGESGEPLNGPIPKSPKRYAAIATPSGQQHKWRQRP